MRYCSSRSVLRYAVILFIVLLGFSTWTFGFISKSDSEAKITPVTVAPSPSPPPRTPVPDDDGIFSSSEDPPAVTPPRTISREPSLLKNGWCYDVLFREKESCPHTKYLSEIGCAPEECSGQKVCVATKRVTPESCPLLRQFYDIAMTEESDIHRLVPIIHSYAAKSSSVVEMGSRGGHSTSAILTAYPKNATIIDLFISPDVHTLTQSYKSCAPKGRMLNVVQSDDLKVVLEPTEMLFIDTLHDYKQLQRELDMHADKATKWILMHDVISFAYIDEGSKKALGLAPAIVQFMKEHPEWEEEAYFPFSNGLLVLRRKSAFSELCSFCKGYMVSTESTFLGPLSRLPYSGKDALRPRGFAGQLQGSTPFQAVSCFGETKFIFWRKCKHFDMMRIMQCSECDPKLTCEIASWPPPPCQQLWLYYIASLQVNEISTSKFLPLLYGYAMFRGLESWTLALSRTGHHSIILPFLGTYPMTGTLFVDEMTPEVLAITKHYRRCAPTTRSLAVFETLNKGLPRSIDAVDVLVLEGAMIESGLDDTRKTYSSSVKQMIIAIETSETVTDDSNGRAAVKRFLTKHRDQWNEVGYYPFAGYGWMIVLGKVNRARCSYCDVERHKERYAWKTDN